MEKAVRVESVVFPDRNLGPVSWYIKIKMKPSNLVKGSGKGFKYFADRLCSK